MPKYNVDVNVSVWGNDSFEIEASDRVEAEAIAIDMAFDALSLGYFDTEVVAERVEEIDEEDNDETRSA